MNVSDIIIRQIDHLRPDDEIEKAALVIFSGNADTIPVSEGKKVIGVVTKNSVLAHLLGAGYLKNGQKTISLHDIQEKAPGLLSSPISQIMTKGLKVKTNTSLTDAHTIMDRYDVETLPVVDQVGRLLGIVSRADIFRALVERKILFPEGQSHRDFLTGTYFQNIDWANRFKYELPDLLKLFEKQKVKTILDVGCGSGELSIELANRGYSVVGIDRNSKLIEEANRNKLKLRRKSLGNISFWNKEAEDFLFDFDLTFDAIICMSNSISYNPNNYRHLLKRTANSLTANGVLVLQITNFDKVIGRKNRLLNFSMAKSKDQSSREYAFIEFFDSPIKDKTILKNFLMLVSEGKTWKWSGIRNSLLAYTDEERIKRILENEEFGNIKTYGSSFDGKHWDYLFRKPFDPLTSDWLNVVATRNA